MALLCNQAPISCHHMKTPRGFPRAHLSLGSVLFPQSICAVVGYNPPVPDGYRKLSGVCVVCVCLWAHVYVLAIRIEVHENRSSVGSLSFDGAGNKTEKRTLWHSGGRGHFGEEEGCWKVVKCYAWSHIGINHSVTVYQYKPHYKPQCPNFIFKSPCKKERLLDEREMG